MHRRLHEPGTTWILGVKKRSCTMCSFGYRIYIVGILRTQEFSFGRSPGHTHRGGHAQRGRGVAAPKHHRQVNRIVERGFYFAFDDFEPSARSLSAMCRRAPARTVVPLKTRTDSGEGSLGAWFSYCPDEPRSHRRCGYDEGFFRQFFVTRLNCRKPASE